MTIAFIEWHSTTMLWGLAGIALPIVAHLLSRRASRRITLPTARFLAQAHARRGRRLRLSQWLLLAIRVVIVALIAMAFARPGWRDGNRAPGPLAQQEVVIVLDASASMARNAKSGAIFARAVDRARQVLESLDSSRDHAGLIIAGVSSEPALPRLSGNFAALRARLDTAAVSAGSTDLAEAIRVAHRLPGSRGGPPGQSGSAPRRLVLITDAQRSHLEDLTGLAESLRTSSLMIEAIAAEDPAPNLALTSVAVSPARPARGGTFTVAAMVSNHGPRAQTVEVRCTLEPEGEQALRPVLLSLESGAAGTASFVCEAVGTDPIRVRVSLPPDDLDADNVVMATVPIRPSTRVLIVTDPTFQATEAVQYLDAALHPDAESRYEVLTASPSQSRIDSIDWDDLDAVILCEAGRVPLDWLTQIDDAVRGGTGLWWFIDSTASAASTDAFASLDSDSPALPLVVRELLGAPQRVIWSSADPMHEALASFDGPALGSILGVQHERVTQMSVMPGAAAIIRAHDGTPVVAVRTRERGRVLMFNGSIARGSTEFTRQPVFPALVHEWTAWLTGSEHKLPTIHPGRGALIELPMNTPQDVTLRVDPAATFARVNEADRQFVRFDVVSELGEVRLLDATSGAWLGGASVTVDPRESDLRTADEALLASWRGSSEQGSTGGVHAAASVADPIHAGRLVEFWPWLLLGAGLGAIAEGLVTMSVARREVRV